MRYVPTEKLELGMLIAFPIYDEKGRMLISGYSELSEKYMLRIRELGLQGVYIEDRHSSDIEIRDMISDALRKRGIYAVKTLDYELCSKVAKEIVNEIVTNMSWDYGMVDIRTFDEYLYHHSVQVAVIAVLMGIGLGLSDKELEHLCLAGLLHDIGMIHVGKNVSTTDETLSYIEVANIKLHPKISLRMIEEHRDIMMTTRMAILQHHENVDGSGYPEGKKGGQIHRFAKILHVADTFDALVSNRPYRKPHTHMEAVEFLMGGCDVQFDKEVVLAFMQSVPVYPKGFPICLSDGREGFVLRNKKGNPLRPVVRLFDGTELDLSDIKKNRSITIQSVMETEEHFM